MKMRHGTAALAVAQLGMIGNAVASHQLKHSHNHLERRAPPATQVGCFRSAGGSASSNGAGSWPYQSWSWCGDACYAMGKPVASVTDGLMCYCADLLPAKSDELDSSQCSSTCAGYPAEICGGPTAYTVLLTNLNPAVGSVDSSSDSNDGSGNLQQNQAGPGTFSSSSSPQASTVVTTAATTIVQGQQTVVQTVAAAGSPDTITSTNSSGHSTGSTIGIAVGVVAGILLFAGLVLFTVFYLRRRRRMKNAENGHARADSLNAFVAGGSTHTIPMPAPVAQNDSRLDPRLMVERRRMSAGSVFADNEDYSRRILKVANPDE